MGAAFDDGEPNRTHRRMHARWAGALLIALGYLLPGHSAALSTVGIDPPARTDADRSCYELAAEISELLDVRSGTAGFWSRTDNQTAGVMTLVTPLPAVGYLAYNTFLGFKEDEAADQASERIKALRKQSANKQCFSE